MVWTSAGRALTSACALLRESGHLVRRHNVDPCRNRHHTCTSCLSIMRVYGACTQQFAQYQQTHSVETAMAADKQADHRHGPRKHDSVTNAHQHQAPSPPTSHLQTHTDKRAAQRHGAHGNRHLLGCVSDQLEASDPKHSPGCKPQAHRLPHNELLHEKVDGHLYVWTCIRPHLATCMV